MKKIKELTTGCFLLQPTVFEDERGYFLESFNQKKFQEFTQETYRFIQDNESKSQKNVFRGFHYQINEYAQTKLIRVVQGAIIDIVIDLRENSDTYQQVFQVELNQDNKYQLLIPKGFAHGFYVKSDEVIVNYKVDALYNKENERGLNIKNYWHKMDLDISFDKLILSEKDQHLP